MTLPDITNLDVTTDSVRPPRSGLPAAATTSEAGVNLFSLCLLSPPHRGPQVASVTPVTTAASLARVAVAYLVVIVVGGAWLAGASSRRCSSDGGDVAATDLLRTSARKGADKLAAENVLAHLAGKPLSPYQPAGRRWGSVLGVEEDGLQVFTPSGKAFRFPAWAIGTVLQPLIVRRGIYGGVRRR